MKRKYRSSAKTFRERSYPHNPEKVHSNWDVWRAFSSKLTKITESTPYLGSSSRWTKEGERYIPSGWIEDSEGWYEWFGGFTDPKGSPIGQKKSTINDSSGFDGTPAARIFDSLPNWHKEGEDKRGIPSKENVCKACGKPYGEFWSGDSWELNICSKCSPAQRNSWTFNPITRGKDYEKGT